MDTMLSIITPMLVVGILLSRRCLALEAELDALEDKLDVLEALLDSTRPSAPTPEETN